VRQVNRRGEKNQVLGKAEESQPAGTRSQSIKVRKTPWFRAVLLTEREGVLTLTVEAHGQRFDVTQRGGVTSRTSSIRLRSKGRVHPEERKQTRPKCEESSGVIVKPKGQRGLVNRYGVLIKGER